MKNRIGIFFGRLIVLILILFVLDFIIGEALRYYFFRQKGGWDAKTVYTMQKMDAEVVVVGSSRASHHYVSDSLTKELGMSVFNTGRDGNFNLYSSAVIEATLNRYSPRLIIIDVIEGEFADRPGSYDYLSSLLPFYRNHKEIRPILNLRSPFEPYKLISRIYPFNSLFPVIAQNNLKPKFNYLNNGGYDPLTRYMNRDFKEIYNAPEYEIDQQRVEVFKNSLLICKAKKIPVVVVTSPYFDVLNYQDKSLELIRKICENESTPFIDYSRDDRFKRDRSAFDDFQHLNDGAARAYTKTIADTIISNRKLFNP